MCDKNEAKNKAWWLMGHLDRPNWQHHVFISCLYPLYGCIRYVVVGCTWMTEIFWMSRGKYGGCGWSAALVASLIKNHANHHFLQVIICQTTCLCVYIYYMRVDWNSESARRHVLDTNNGAKTLLLCILSLHFCPLRVYPFVTGLNQHSHIFWWMWKTIHSGILLIDRLVVAKRRGYTLFS